MQKEKIIILAVVYQEPEWQLTKACIEKTGLPVHWVDRNPAGYGSLAESINRAFLESKAVEYEYAWIVTNITFDPMVPKILANGMRTHGLACVHPAFDSDHWHERPDHSNEVKEVPFVEFTAAMVRTDVFAEFPLDQQMMYWGHDPDHGTRLWLAGHKVGVDHSVTIGHTYIRNSRSVHPATRKRKQARAEQDEPTKAALQNKWGNNIYSFGDWRWMFPKDPGAAERFFITIRKIRSHYGK